MTSSAPAVDESITLAKDRLGIPAVLFFILSAMAPMTVVAGVVTTMYAVTGLSAIGAAFVAPALSALALRAMVWAGLANYATLLGVAPGSTEAWALPAAFALAGVIGIGYGSWLRSARPDIYQGIGLGAP